MSHNTTAPQARGRAGSSMAVSIALHAGAVLLAFAFAYIKTRMPKTVEAPVAVTFRPAPPPPPPPPPAARHKQTPRQGKPTKVPQQQQVIQPKEIPKVGEKAPEMEESEEDQGGEGGG